MSYYIKIFVLAAIFLELLWIGSGLVGNGFLKKLDPSTSAFIQEYELEHFKLVQLSWKNLDKISPHLIRAVLVAEDDAFFEHGGVDFKELKKSWETNWKKKKIVRGASTLTMQLAKNLYLSTQKSILRKINEILLALDLEWKLSKRRILEIYLNIAEWGPGIYGAEAASQYYFKKSVQSLNANQAAYLASLLPNPHYLTGKGKHRAQWRQRLILKRMRYRPLPKGLLQVSH